jgi:iron complex transport system substrate-binding protein
MTFPPRRLVCLTEETVETLYWMQEQDRIVGVTSYVLRPPQVRKEKPQVSAFTSANIGIKSLLILQPGPAALTDGRDALVAAIRG